jgi:hypothetical protein
MEIFKIWFQIDYKGKVLQNYSIIIGGNFIHQIYGEFITK